MTLRRIDKAQLESVSSFRAGSCIQANTVGHLFPSGVDIEAPASGAAWDLARRHKLDLVFAACSVVWPEMLAEFHAYCLQQLSDLLPPSHPAKILSNTRPATPLYRIAHWYLMYAARPVTGDNCYSLAIVARKGTRALHGKDAEHLVSEAQLDWWQGRHRRLLAGEKPPILGDV